MEKKLYAFSRAALALCIVLYLGGVWAAGGTLWGLALYWGAFFLGVMCAGAFFTRLLFGETGPLGLPLAFCLGALALYISFALCSILGKPGFALLPVLPFGLLWLWRRRGKKLLLPSPSYAAAVLLLLCAGFLFLYTFCAVLPFARADRVGNFFYHQDMLWSVGNAAGVRFGMPVQDMRFAATSLHYHYLNDVTAGLLALAVGQPAYEGLCFYYYAPAAAVLLFSLYAVARHFCAKPLTAAAFPFLAVFGGGAGSVFHFVTNINGQGTSTLTLCGGLALLLLLEKKDGAVKWPAALAAGLSLGFVMSMFKSTVGCLFALAVAAACLVGLFTKQVKSAHLAALAGLCGGFAVAYFTLFRFAVNNLVFSGFAGLARLPAALAGASPLGLLLWLGALLYILPRFTKLSVSRLAVNALFVGGSFAYVLFTHYSASQIYFLYAALPMLWLAGLETGEAALANRRSLCAAAAAAVIAWGGWATASSLSGEARTGVQAALRIGGLRQSGYDESYITAEDYDAMLWLRENTPESAIFATNRNNKYYAAGEGTFHYYSAVSQRRCYLESYRYCMDYSGKYHEVRRRLEQVSDAIFHTLPAGDAFALAQKEGIDYLVVFAPVNTPDWPGTPVYANGTVLIYAVG